jgi:lysophospholipid acyltransferase (LPLAT)-like uncharacterized protein
VHAIGGWRRVALWSFACLMRLWGRTLRLELSDEDRRAITHRDEPVAIVLWHNRLFLSAEIFRRFRQGRPAYALVSASRDGAWLDAFFSAVGMHTVRGSSNKLGREAVSGLVDVLRAGHDIGITPDGPRGPCYDLKPGGLIVARRTHVPLLLIGGEFASAWRLKSWDRFYLPKPFSRVRLRCEYVPNSEIAGDRDDAMARLKVRLLAINRDG